MDATVALLGLVSEIPTINGRIKLQKLAYFSKVHSKQSPLQVRMHFYGPFCEDLADTLQDFVLDGVLQEGRDHSISIGEDQVAFQDICESNQQALDDALPSIRKALKKFGNKKNHDLELLATVHFIYDRQHNLYQENDDITAVCKSVYKVKNGRFEENEILAAFKELVTLKLIPEKALAVG